MHIALSHRFYIYCIFYCIFCIFYIFFLHIFHIFYCIFLCIFCIIYILFCIFRLAATRNAVVAFELRAVELVRHTISGASTPGLDGDTDPTTGGVTIP